jgi:hypothetical protein
VVLAVALLPFALYALLLATVSAFMVSSDYMTPLEEPSDAAADARLPAHE